MDYINVNDLNVLEKVLIGPDSLKIAIVVFLIVASLIIACLFSHRGRGVIADFGDLAAVFTIFLLCSSVAFILTSPSIASQSLERSNIALKYELPEDAKVFNEGAFWKIYYIDEDLRKSVKFKVKLNDSGEPFDYDSSEATKKMIAKVEKKV